MKKDEKIAYIQWLRVFAAAAVVLMHTAANSWNTTPIACAQWQTLTIWDSLVRWPVPVFVMITGALFLPKRTELRRVLTRYLPRLVVAWLVWSWIYALRSGKTGEELTKAVFSGHYHLWYLPFLCGVYLTLPFVQKIAQEDGLTRQLLVMSGVIGLGIPWLADWVAVFFPEQTAYARILANHLNFAFFFDLLFYLLLGHVLHRTELSKNARRWIYAAGILGVVLTMDGTIQASARIAGPSSLFFGHAAPGTLCAAAAVFVFAKYNLTRLPRAVEWMANCSFGIYLSHVLLIELLEENGHHVLLGDPAWTVPVLAAAVFAAALALTAVISKIPVVGKYLT